MSVIRFEGVTKQYPDGTVADLMQEMMASWRAGPQEPPALPAAPGAKPPLPGEGEPPATVLGARVAWLGQADEEGGEPTWSVVLQAVPEGSLAERIGLVAGDRILTLDGHAPTAKSVAGVAETVKRRGQLRLEVLRRDGQTETFDVSFD